MKYTDEQIEALLDFVTDLQGKVSEADDKFNRHEFADKHAEKLGKYVDKMKALNGDDFDLMNEAYSEYHESYSDLDEEQYVDALVENIERTMTHLKEALADGDTAEAAHVAEEAKEQIEDAAESIDEGAHKEVKEEVKEEEPASDEQLKEDVKEDIHEAEERAEESEMSEEKADDKADEMVNEAQDEEQKDEEQKDEEELEEEEFQKLLDEEMKRLEE